MKLIIFLSYEKVSKSFIKKLGHKNLSKIHFIPQGDNGPLEIKGLSIRKK